MWSFVLQNVLAWTKTSEWRRASKCKILIQEAQLHLIALKNRKETIIRQSRVDIAQLLQNGRLQQALIRAEQLYKDQCLLSAYDQIDQLCECIMTNLSHIRQQSALQDLPIEVNQAVSSLIFAASRCGELPELHKMRFLFKDQFGCKFEVSNVELLPGNLVNPRIKQNLSVKSAPDRVKLHITNDIAVEYNLQPIGLQHSEQRFDSQLKEKAEVMDLDIQDICSDGDDAPITASKFQIPNKIPSHNKGHSDRGSTTGFFHGNKVKRKEVAVTQNFEPSTSTSSAYYGTPPVLETSIVYLDDLEVKSHHKESSSATKKNGRSCLKKKSVPPKMERRRFSMDSSVDRWKAQNGSSSSSSASSNHVHPKLPHYEDVVAKLSQFKVAEHRQRKGV